MVLVGAAVVVVVVFSVVASQAMFTALNIADLALYDASAFFERRLLSHSTFRCLGLARAKCVVAVLSRLLHFFSISHLAYPCSKKPYHR